MSNRIITYNIKSIRYIRVKNNRLYLFSFHFSFLSYFLFISYFEDLELEVGIISQIVISCDSVLHISHVSHATITVT